MRHVTLGTFSLAGGAAQTADPNNWLRSGQALGQGLPVIT